MFKIIVFMNTFMYYVYCGQDNVGRNCIVNKMEKRQKKICPGKNLPILCHFKKGSLTCLEKCKSELPIYHNSSDYGPPPGPNRQ